MAAPKSYEVNFAPPMFPFDVFYHVEYQTYTRTGYNSQTKYEGHLPWPCWTLYHTWYRCTEVQDVQKYKMLVISPTGKIPWKILKFREGGGINDSTWHIWVSPDLLSELASSTSDVSTEHAQIDRCRVAMDDSWWCYHWASVCLIPAAVSRS